MLVLEMEVYKVSGTVLYVSVSKRRGCGQTGKSYSKDSCSCLFSLSDNPIEGRNICSCHSHFPIRLHKSHIGQFHLAVMAVASPCLIITEVSCKQYRKGSTSVPPNSKTFWMDALN